MPLSDTFKKLKDKLEGKSSEKSDHGTTSGSTTRGTASPRLSSDKASSSSVVAPYEGQATKEKTPSRLSESHTPLTTAIGRIGTKSSDKNKTKSGLHGILAGGEKSGYATPNPNSKNALKQKRRKAKKEQRKKEVEERRLRGEMGGKRSKMNRRAQPKSKYRNETFGFYPLMTSDPDQHEKFDYKDMSQLSEDDLGETVTIRARIDRVRPHGPNLAFVVLRYQMDTMSAVLKCQADPTRPRKQSISQQAAPVTAPSGRPAVITENVVASQVAGQASAPTGLPPTVEGVPIDSQVQGVPFLAPPVTEVPVANDPTGAKTVPIIADPTVNGAAMTGQAANHLAPSGQAIVTEQAASPGQAIVTEQAAYPTVGQDFAGDSAGQRQVQENGVAIGSSSGGGGARPRHHRRRTRPERDHNDLAGVDSDYSSDSSSGSDSTDYDSGYDQTHKEGVVTEDFIRWIGHLRKESLVHITGVLQKPKNSSGKSKEASPRLSGMELAVQKCFVVGRVFEHAPFQLGEIEGRYVATADEKKSGAHKEREEEDAGGGKVTVRQEMNNRTFDLRAPSNQAIFRIRAACCRLFRQHLDNLGFMEMQTAKLQGSATEGGASVFKLDYFGRPAYLAQSPQLAKQQAIISDFGRVYEVGSIYRAENSQDKRHMTEFVGLDIEMTIDQDYHECMKVIDGTLKAIFKGVQEQNRHELDVVKQRFPHEDLIIPDETVVLHYKQGVQILREAGHTHEDGSQIEDDEDFDTPTEKRLGALVKERYNTDYYILDKFPLAVRPFYTMPDPLDPRYSNSFDIFVRGQEILSGGQRIHDSNMLETKMKEAGMDPEVLGEYTHAFRLGAPPHAGGGVGLDRLVMLMLQLGNIRFAAMNPRDPKSFPDSGKPPPQPRPKVGRHGTLPPLEDLIAAYGDSTNTSWLDERYTIWRHVETGAAIGYVRAKANYGVVWGPPLCAPEDMEDVIQAWMQHCDDIKLKPVWCCLDETTTEILAKRYRWKALSCIAETRVDPAHYNGTDESNVHRKIQGAKKSGVKVSQLEHEPSEEFQRELDERIKEWSRNREGTQMHISDVSGQGLVKDAKHRQYFVAKNEQGKIVGVVVLARLSPEHGAQIKWSLQFPGAPNGTSEYLLSEAFKAAAERGIKSLTFGASASEKLTPLKNKSSLSLRLLSHTYESIKSAGNLGNKTNYRHKWGTTDEPLYVAYPKHGLGARGISAIMESVTDDSGEKPSKHKHDQRHLKRVDDASV